MYKVMFACVHNAGRSQMAAAFFNHLADRKDAEAISAGTDPGNRVHPEVLAVMQEIGIDLSNAKPQKLTQELASGAQLLILWAAATSVPMSQVYSGMTGLCQIPKVVLWRKSGLCEMKYGVG
jgi:arsenate reductase (thioredoxin)